jgi:hypothetical protein
MCGINGIFKFTKIDKTDVAALRSMNDGMSYRRPNETDVWNDDKMGKVELVCAFEAMEHFQDPLKELDEMFKLSNNVLVSQSFLPFPLPGPKDWWYYCLEHGQHINFYSQKTFMYLAEKYGKKLHSCGELHLFTAKNIEQTHFERAVLNPKVETVQTNMKSKTVDDMLYAIKLMEKMR